MESILEETGANYTQKETTPVYRKLASQVWKYSPWIPKQIQDVNLQTKAQTFALHAFMLHTLNRDETERVLIKHLAKISQELQPFTTGTMKQKLQQMESAILGLQRLHNDFEYKLQQIAAVMSDDQSTKALTERGKIRLLLNDIHKSLYHIDPNKREELQKVVAAQAEETLTRFIQPEWTVEDVRKLKQRIQKENNKTRTYTKLHNVNIPPKPRHSNRNHTSYKPSFNNRNRNNKKFQKRWGPTRNFNRNRTPRFPNQGQKRKAPFNPNYPRRKFNKKTNFNRYRK